ncbi:hypothetical protein THIOKS12710008 [Thiocapsa sp. KS1]|jgi:hypothetical protein|nr:hypothetical protein [Thiocapsa sp. KS1]CRI66263.1 hypothetical protein THIOKS12710008 [Thiocapsa sp. KS1]
MIHPDADATVPSSLDLAEVLAAQIKGEVQQLRALDEKADAAKDPGELSPIPTDRQNSARTAGT